MPSSNIAISVTNKAGNSGHGGHGCDGALLYPEFKAYALLWFAKPDLNFEFVIYSVFI